MNEHYYTAQGQRLAEAHREAERRHGLSELAETAIAQGGRLWAGKFVHPDGMYDVYIQVEPEK